METCIESNSNRLPIAPIYTFLDERGWKHQSSQSNETNEYIFSKEPTNLDEVRIRLLNNQIVVAVPIFKSNYLYATKFTSYFKACEFIETHINTYENALLNDE